MIKNNQNNNVKIIFEKMISATRVAIFAHDNQDGDAYGSSLGLCLFLRKLKIDARITDMDLITDKMVLKFIDSTIPEADEEFINNSLGVILDSGNANIISSSKYMKCQSTIRIDHHIKTEVVANLEWVEPEYSSTSEMIGWLILACSPENLDAQIANALYLGILTDTNLFMFANTQSSTFKLIQRFYDVNFDKQGVQAKLILNHWNDVLSQNLIRNEVIITDDQIAYLIISQNVIEKYNIPKNENYIYVMNNIIEFKIWFSIYYKPDKNIYSVSIRSREYDVRQVALKFNGGGHKLASGFRIKDLKELPKILKEIRLLLK